MEIVQSSVLLVSAIPEDMLETSFHTFFYLDEETAEELMEMKHLAVIDLTEHSTHIESQYEYLNLEWEKLEKRIFVLLRNYSKVIIIAPDFEYESIKIRIQESKELEGLDFNFRDLVCWELISDDDDTDEEDDDEPDFAYAPIVQADMYKANKVSIDEPYHCTIHHMIDGILNEKFPSLDKKTQEN